MRTHGKMRKRLSLTLVLAMIVSITSLLWTMPGREAHAATQAELMHTANDRLVDNPAAETRPGQ
ncbi:hypothetical protein B5M42_007750 [Paenibacillus athensensis]|uniref:Uncharacterized protein n=1 Tax=Paenibacillus athensensis TaxID=1967502 RepID=A0A4Y8Q3Q8_9BACL|nr:hypothetical protein [Paenibacillus athensensis]MCD1258727.1 hypothetical protein [Paenibacillus athensensis]